MQGRIVELGREMTKFATSHPVCHPPFYRMFQPKPCPPPLRQTNQIAFNGRLYISLGPSRPRPSHHFNHHQQYVLSAGAGAVWSRPVSIACFSAPSLPPPASVSGSPVSSRPSEAFHGTELCGPCWVVKVINYQPTPRSHYVGEPIMKRRISASSPPIFVLDDANDVEEEGSADRRIGRSVLYAA